MMIKDIHAFRAHLQQELNHTSTGWDADFMGSRKTLANGIRAFGFFNFFQGGTDEGRKAIEGKLRGVLEMAQNDQAIYEITQNAADCKSTELVLWYTDEYLLAYNNGEQFSTADVRSILDTFASEKADRERPENEGMIGQYGVGFKLFHRLVGRESGLEELLDDYSGPMVFSWSAVEQLNAFLAGNEDPWVRAALDADAPWFFKILLTCFPAAPGETVRDMDHAERVPFTREEAERFRQFAQDRLASLRNGYNRQGSLFFLRLGQGKREVLDRHMNEIRSCMGLSLNFLRELQHITVNGERIERLQLHRIDLAIPRNELRAIGFKDDGQDVSITLAWSDDAKEQLLNEPTLYQYFPMTKEAHGMAYVIHSNGLQKQAQRTELNADSPINATLFQRLSEHVQQVASEWMKTEPDNYRSLFKAILWSAFAPSKLKVFHDQVQQPLIDFVQQHVPTMDGLFVPADRVLVRRSQLAIPLDRFGIERHWFHWHAEEDAAVIDRAKDHGVMGLKEATVEQVLRKVGVRELDQWVATLDQAAYAVCLQELQENKVNLSEHGDLHVFRSVNEAFGLNTLLAEPDRLKELEACYAANPVLEQWQPRAAVEAALAEMAEPIWSSATSEVLYQMSQPMAMQALVQRLPEIVLNDRPTPEVMRFMEWWQKYRDQPVANALRQRLMLRTANGDLEWETSLVAERFRVRMPAGNEKDFSLQDLFPGTSGTAVAAFDELHRALLAQGFDEKFLNHAFGRKGERSKQDLRALGDQLVQQYRGTCLVNGCQLAFVAALKNLYPEWKNFESLALRAADGEVYNIEAPWYLDAPVFISPCHVLHDQYEGIKDYLGESWERIKHGKLVLALRPRLGESFGIDTVRDDLDAVHRLAFMNWFATQAERNKGSIDLIRNSEHLPLLIRVLGSDPAEWIEAEEQLCLEQERIPTWIYEWAKGESTRQELLKQLRIETANDAVVQWRSALLAGQPTPPLEHSMHSTNTLGWISKMGGAEKFTSNEHERSIIALLRAAGHMPHLEMRVELEQRAEESTDATYCAWKVAGSEWCVLEYPEGSLPMNRDHHGRHLARCNSATAFAPTDASKRIFIAKDYPLMVALYQLSEGKDASVPIDVRDGYKKVFDRRRMAATEGKKAKERPEKELDLEQRVDALHERQLAFDPASDMSLAELINAIEWEYHSKLLERSEGNQIRFKEVRVAEEGVVVLKRPNVAELPYELVSDRDRQVSGMVLKLRNRGGAYKEVTAFEVLAGSEGEVRIRIPGSPITFNTSTVALVEFPVQDHLFASLVSAWKHATSGMVAERPLIELLNERAPGAQVGFIFGPPGTGKTTELAKRLIAATKEGDTKVLVLTPTNNAADVLYQRITESANDDLAILNSVHRFGTGNKDIPVGDGEPAVVITTMHRFCFDKFANGQYLSAVDWDHVVFDEASMVPLSHALLPIFSLSHHREGASWGALGARFLFAGDPFQLMPVAATPSLGHRIEASKKGTSIRGLATENIYSLLGIDRFTLEEAPKLPGARIHRLATNFRSGRSIVELFSRSRYEGGVTSNRNNDEHDIMLGSDRLAAINLWTFPAELPTKEEGQSEELVPQAVIQLGHSAIHVYSALLATRLAVVLATQNMGKRVIIVCPYGRQVRICQTLVESFNEACSAEPNSTQAIPIGVSSVHRYQGGEAEICIMLLNPAATKMDTQERMAIGKMALFNDPNLINVGLSRAKDVLILLGPGTDSISRSGNSGYHLIDAILSEANVKDLDLVRAASSELEPLLFNGSALAERISIVPLRAHDLFRMNSTKGSGPDLIVLHNKENLNMVMAQDIVLEGIDLNALGASAP